MSEFAGGDHDDRGRFPASSDRDQFEAEEPPVADGVQSPNWIVDVEDVTERSAIVTVQQTGGQRVRYLMPRRSFFDDFTPEAHTNGNGNGHGSVNGNGSSSEQSTPS
jgi:hypothetical protein